MNELQEIFNMCDVMFANADIDYNELISTDITQVFFEDYNNTRVVNSFLFNFSKLQDKIDAKLFKKVLYELKEIDSISFGNTLLYTKTISAIYHTHLNQSISFLHSPREGRFSLSLDLCEVFKPIVVFKTIFDLVNKKKLVVTKHFDKSLNYALLNEQGKMIFIDAFFKTSMCLKRRH